MTDRPDPAAVLAAGEWEMEPVAGEILAALHDAGFLLLHESDKVGVLYCFVHHGILNEDDDVCDFRMDDVLTSNKECRPVVLYGRDNS